MPDTVRMIDTEKVFAANKDISIRRHYFFDAAPKMKLIADVISPISHFLDSTKSAFEEQRKLAARIKNEQIITKPAILVEAEEFALKNLPNMPRFCWLCKS